eukprot:s3247_g6.t1
MLVLMRCVLNHSSECQSYLHSTPIENGVTTSCARCVSFFKEDNTCCCVRQPPFHASRVVPSRIKSPPQVWNGGRVERHPEKQLLSFLDGGFE